MAGQIGLAGGIAGQQQPAAQQQIVEWRMDVARGMGDQLGRGLASQIDRHRLVVPQAIPPQVDEAQGKGGQRDGRRQPAFASKCVGRACRAGRSGRSHGWDGIIMSGDLQTRRFPQPLSASGGFDTPPAAGGYSTSGQVVSIRRPLRAATQPAVRWFRYAARCGRLLNQRSGGFDTPPAAGGYSTSGQVVSIRARCGRLLNQRSGGFDTPPAAGGYSTSGQVVSIRRPLRAATQPAVRWFRYAARCGRLLNQRSGTETARAAAPLANGAAFGTGGVVW
jgi:hypothetical protein